MPLPDHIFGEKQKLKPEGREEWVKSSSRFKHKRDKFPKNSDSKSDLSNFQRCRKAGLLKRNTAQDRLKRLRANLELQNKIFDEACSKSNTQFCDELKNSNVLFEKYSEDSGCMKKKLKTESSTQRKYSADSRLQKIKTSFEKKVPNKKVIDSKFVKYEEKQNEKIIFPASPKNDHEKTNGYDIVQKPERRNSDNDSLMDVDPDSEYSTEANFRKTVSVESPNSVEMETSYFADEISKFRRERTYLALHESFAPDFVMNLAIPIGDLFIVIDTNIFLSHLSFVRKLLTTVVPPYKCPIVVIPWLVLQEIDYAMKKNDTQLSLRAKSANTFIHDCLKKKHPRVFGQSLEDFKQSFKNAVCIDDYILQYCLKFMSLDNNVILLTDDINLCNKSMVSHLSVFTKTEFQRNFHFAV